MTSPDTHQDRTIENGTRLSPKGMPASRGEPMADRPKDIETSKNEKIKH